MILVSGQSTYHHPTYLLIVAGVLEQLIRPQQRTAYQDMKAIELEASTEILAEVFKIRLSEVDEMIRCRIEAENMGSLVLRMAYGLRSSAWKDDLDLNSPYLLRSLFDIPLPAPQGEAPGLQASCSRAASSRFASSSRCSW